MPCFWGHGDSSTGLPCIPLLPTGSTRPETVSLYLVLIYSPQFTLQLGLGDFPTGLGGCDSGGAGRIHERSLQHACPVLLARRQIALPPSLEVVLAFPYTAKRNQILNQMLLFGEVALRQIEQKTWKNDTMQLLHLFLKAVSRNQSMKQAPWAWGVVCQTVHFEWLFDERF